VKPIAVLAAVAIVAAARGDSLALGGMALAQSALDAVKLFGPPDRVATGDSGHEWRWYDAKGLDREILTDDQLVIHEILVARPMPVENASATLVQPADVPLLEDTPAQAAAFLGAHGATALTQANHAALAWRWQGAVIAADVRAGTIARLRALDDGSARRLGYLPGFAAGHTYRAPRLAKVGSVGFPRSAADAGEGGVVIVRVDVDAAGSASRVTVLVGSGHSELDDAEAASMRQSRFTPAYCDGQPCPGALLDREEFVP
jgi:TonB family protein